MSWFSLGPNRGKRSLVVVVQALLLVVGLIALGYCGYIVGEEHFYQTYENWRLDQMKHRRPASTGELLVDAAARLWNRVTGWNPAARRGAERAAEGSLVGRLSVPRLGVSSVILEGDDKQVLQVAIGHIPGTALPGQAGNVALAGHRDTVFRDLRGVHKGDTIALTTPRGEYRYRVNGVEVVSPDDTSVLKPTAEPTLTLVTCYPFSYIGSAPWRFVVRAGETAPGKAVEGARDMGSTQLIVANLPATLPGDISARDSGSALSLIHPSQARRRAVVRHKHSTGRTSEREALDAEDSPSRHAREQNGRGLASRMRVEWSRLFGRLKG